MLFDGGLGEHEGGGDAGVGPAAGHLAQDVEFSRGEPAQGRVGEAGAAGYQCFHDDRVDGGSAGGNRGEGCA